MLVFADKTFIASEVGMSGFPFLRVPFPKNGNPFSNRFLSMFLRWLKVHTHFDYLFAEICYGFRVPVSRNPVTQNLVRVLDS
jgi:hypothetical protein